MLAIRLARIGAKKKPAYRVIVTDKQRARDSRSVEIVGHYNPVKNPIVLQLDRERIDYWLARGAQPSETVRRLMKYEPAEQTAQQPEARERPAAAAAQQPAVEPAPPAPAAEPGPESASPEASGG
jgi:small subunit ribosomal protein S16